MDVELPGVDEGFLERVREEKAKIQDEIAKLRERASELKTLLEDIWKDEKRAEYDLTAVFIHRGSSPSFGHYFIYQRWLPDHPDQWFKYNDSDVSVVSKEEVLADTTGSTANPYLVCSFILTDCLSLTTPLPVSWYSHGRDHRWSKPSRHLMSQQETTQRCRCYDVYAIRNL